MEKKGVPYLPTTSKSMELTFKKFAFKAKQFVNATRKLKKILKELEIKPSSR